VASSLPDRSNRPSPSSGSGRGEIVFPQTQTDGGIWTFAYVTTGDFISQTTVTDPRGNPTTYRFNSAGYLIA